MATEKINSLKLFLFSTLITLIVLFLGCYFWTNFKTLEVANVMFWAGAITIIAGGSFFYPHNKYQGQSVAMMTTLKDKAPENADSIQRSEKRMTNRMIQGFSIASPGIILIIISWWIFSNI